ncbi:serine--tRNA ligase [Alphaproteobacteria bacterium]|nr:serine--tRNA ligase [Alphaproteobacteria bacterium]
MLDIRWIRENPAAFDAALETRDMEPMASKLIDLDVKRRATQTELQEAQNLRNETSKKIGTAKASGGDAETLIAKVAALKDRMRTLGTQEQNYSERLQTILSTLPNIPSNDVPEGEDEESNVNLRQIGTPPSFDFDVLDHVTIGENLGGMHFEKASRLSGARFVVLSGQLARLDRAIGAFMLDLHTKEFGYTEVTPPVLVRSKALYGTGQLPKFDEDLFQTKDDFWLIPTAEVPLTNLVAEEILDEIELPLRFTALTLCFRSEAGAAGRDTRGMLRQHQFNKVELVSIVHPGKAEAEHERMTSAAEEVLRQLGLAYRVMVLSTGDMGFSARKTYDLEVWMPSQQTYREISSCSNCGDFQARRMRARFRPAGEKGTQFVHTLNGSGLAVGRTLIAILENYQQADGSVTIPNVLRPYMDGCDRLEPA